MYENGAKPAQYRLIHENETRSFGLWRLNQKFPNSQRPTLNHLTPNLHFLRQLRREFFKIERCQQGLGVHGPTAVEGQIGDQLLAGTLLWIAVSHQAGAGGGFIGLTAGKALPDQCLIQGSVSLLGQGDQGDAAALGLQGLSGHQIAGWGQQLHGHGRGFSRGGLHQGNRAAAARIEAIAGWHQMDPCIEAGASGAAGSAAADRWLATLSFDRWCTAEAKCQGKARRGASPLA